MNDIHGFYVILEDHNSTTLVHTASFQSNKWMVEGATIVKVLDISDFEKAHEIYNEFIEQRDKARTK